MAFLLHYQFHFFLLWSRRKWSWFPGFSKNWRTLRMDSGWIYHSYSLDPVLSLVFSPWFGFEVHENWRVRRGSVDFPSLAGAWAVPWLTEQTGEKKRFCTCSATCAPPCLLSTCLETWRFLFVILTIQRSFLSSLHILLVFSIFGHCRTYSSKNYALIILVWFRNCTLELHISANQWELWATLTGDYLPRHSSISRVVRFFLPAEFVHFSEYLISCLLLNILEKWVKKNEAKNGRVVQEGGYICIPMADSYWGLTESNKIL